MAKLLLMSVLVVPPLVGRLAASKRRGVAALKWTVLIVGTFEVAYVLAVAFFYFRL